MDIHVARPDFHLHLLNSFWNIFDFHKWQRTVLDKFNIIFFSSSFSFITTQTLDKRIEYEITQMDERILTELDQRCTEQQATLEKAGVPGFYCTANPQEVKLQMYVLEFILKLSKMEFGSGNSVTWNECGMGVERKFNFEMHYQASDVYAGVHPETQQNGIWIWKFCKLKLIWSGCGGKIEL